MISVYRSVMDPSVNALHALAPAQRFQVMTALSVMWTVIFCTATGAWMWYGELIAGHVLVALGLVVTGVTFRFAARLSGEAPEADHSRSQAIPSRA